MSWRVLVVNRHCKLTFKNNYLVYRNHAEHEMIHLSEIDILMLETTDITITTMLISKLVSYGVLIIYCDEKRMPIASLTPYYGRHDSSLQLKKQLGWDPEYGLEVWTEIISQKLVNQSRLLKRNYFFEDSDKILYFHDGLEVGDPSIREGHAAKVYFSALFGKEFTRKDSNKINSALDYGYTLILSMFSREIIMNGCMTQLGLKHCNQFNQYNLASDIMEPFRCLVDDIVFVNKHHDFHEIKRDLLTLFQNKYIYKNKQMFLTNIVKDYTRHVIKCLNKEEKGVPEFRI